MQRPADLRTVIAPLRRKAAAALYWRLTLMINAAEQKTAFEERARSSEPSIEFADHSKPQVQLP